MTLSFFRQVILLDIRLSPFLPSQAISTTFELYLFIKAALSVEGGSELPEAGNYPAENELLAFVGSR